MNSLQKIIIIGISVSFFFLTACKNDDQNDGSMQPTDGYPMPEDVDEIKQLLKDKCLDTIKFRKGEVIADIGAGNGFIEAMLSLFNDSLTFYIQDIDSSVCNQKSINETVDFYQNVNGRPFTNKFVVVNGTDTETNLPDSTFDKILMLWTYQYLIKPKVFITDVRNKLKNGGLFYVINPEQDYEFGKEIKAKYGWNGSTIEQEITDIIDCGFELIRVSRNYDDGGHTFIMVFKKNN